MERHDSPHREVPVTLISQFADPYRLLVEAVKDYAIYLIDPDGYVATWNAGAQYIKGYPADEIIGHHFSCFYPPEDMARNIPQQHLEQAVAQGKVEDEGWRVKKDGTRYWANDVITPLFDDHGTLLGFSKVLRDLSERHANEQKIQEQQMILTGIIDTAMDGIITVDETYRVIVFNRAAEIMFRCSAAEALGQPLDTFIPERFRTSHARLIQNFADTGIVSQKMAVSRIIYGLRATGEEFPLEAAISQTEVGGRKRFTAVLRDVTERLKTEKVAQERLELQARLEAIATMAPCVLCTFRQGADGSVSFIYASPKIFEIYGLEPETLAVDASPIFGLTHPDDLEAVKTTFRESTRTMTMWEFEFRVQNPHKGEIWVEARLTPVHEPDGSILWHGFLMNITERKQATNALHESQLYLKQLIESLPQIVWTTNNQGQCTYVSPQWYDYTGIQPITPLPETWGYLVDPEDSERNARPFQEALHNGQMFDAEYRLRRADGVYRWFKVRALPFRDQSGNVVKWIGTSTDIDDHKQTEVALRQWADAFTNCAHGIAIGDHATSQIMACNPAFATLFRQPVEAIVGLRIQDVYDPAEWERVKRHILRADQTGKAQYETRMRRQDGTVFEVQMDVVSVRDEDGRVRYRVVTMQNISERKQVERRLATEATVSRILAEVDSLTEAAQKIIQTLCEAEGWEMGVVWEVDDQARLLRCVDGWSVPDPGFEALVVQTRSLILRPNGCLPSRVWVNRLPVRIEHISEENCGCQRAPQALKAGLKSALAFSIVYQGEVIGVMDFMSRNLIPHSPPMMSELTILGSQIGQFMARKRTQKHMQRFISASPVVIFALAVDGTTFKPIWTSDTIFEMTGYDAQEAIKIGWWESHLHPEDRDRVLAAQPELGKTSHQILEYRFRRQDSTYFWVRDEKRVLVNEHGQVTEIVGSWSDITERVHLEEQFRQSQKMEAVGQLAGGVAHDFNNLLTVIIGYSDLLAMRFPVNDPKRNTVLEIKQAGERAAELTRQLLAFSRKQVLEPKILDVNDIVGNIEKMLRRLISEDIFLTTVLQPNLSKVKVDPGQLEQVIINLAVNARDAMPQGGRLTIETETVELDEAVCKFRPGYKPGWYTRISIADTGCGMTSEVQSHIFEPFFTTKEQGKGTGLGLATVFGIVKQSEGYIEVYSEVGLGSCFKIYFPVVDAGWFAEVSDGQAESIKSGAETILLVEDEEVVRTITRLSLETFGYHVIEAASGTQALELIKTVTTPVALLITDVVMPGMNGRQVADQLRQFFPELKVLFMSGYTNDAVFRHGIVEDNIAFIQKPFTPTLLAKRVREVLEGNR